MKNFAAPFLKLFVPLTVVILGAAFLYSTEHRAQRFEVLSSGEQSAVQLGAAMLDRQVQIIRRDIEFLARHYYVKPSYETPGHPNLEQMAKGFSDFLVVKPSYDRMRWIDADGQERISVNLVDSLPAVLSGTELLKTTDTDFEQIMKGNPGQIYISSARLKTNEGVAISPAVPIVRVGIPVSDGRGQKIGAFVLDYMADEMVAYVEAVTPAVQDHFFITGTAGYFFHAPNDKDEWDFEFQDPQRSFAHRFPDAWQKVISQNDGQFLDANGLWTFRTIYPLSSGMRDVRSIRNNLIVKPEASEQSRSWRTIAYLPIDRVELWVEHDQKLVYLVTTLLILSCAIFCFLVVRSRLAHQNADHRLRIFFEHSLVGMAITSPEKKWISVNAALCEMLGYSEAELRNTTWEALTYPEDVRSNLREFQQILDGERDSYQLEKRFVRADGQLLYTAISVQVVREKDGLPRYFLLLVQDITDKKHAEQETTRLHSTLMGFIDHLPGLAYIKDHHSRILIANRHFGDMLGMAPDQIVGKLTCDLVPGAEGEKFTEEDLRVMSTGETEHFVHMMGQRAYETIKFPIRYTDADTGMGGITIDVTERQRNEQRLRLQAARDHVLLEMPRKCLELDESLFLSYVLDMAEALTESKIGFIHFVDDAQETIELAAWSSQTLSKYCKVIHDRHYPVSRAGIWADAVRQKQTVIYNDYAAVTFKKGLPQGHAELARVISIPVIEGDLVRLMAGVGNKECDYIDDDIETVKLLANEAWHLVRQRRTEVALRIATQVVNASSVVCFRWALTDGWPVLYVSENVNQWGYTAENLQAGKPPFAQLIHPDDSFRVGQEVAQYTAEGVLSYSQEYRLMTAQNKIIWVVDRTTIQRDADGNALFCDGVLTDITERKAQELQLANNLAEQQALNKRLGETQTQLLQSEKMASIGQLAAGIAHELNNPIGFVHSNLGTLDAYVHDLMALIDAYDDVIKTELAESASLHKIELLREEQDFNYIREDITQLMHESKDGLSRVRRIVQDMKSFSHVSEQTWQWADIHQGIESTLNIVWNELKYKCTIIKDFGDLPKVYCMISQLNQVFMNLFVNAGHAIEDKGEIILRTTRLGANEVCIEVSDTGKGIAPEHVKRIFEPFFTTKPVGKGTGLGLSLSYNIIEKHHGRLEVDSVIGEGTTFRIILPINQAENTDSTTPDTTV